MRRPRLAQSEALGATGIAAPRIAELRQPGQGAVNQYRAADGKLWQPRFFDRALRSVKEYNEHESLPNRETKHLERNGGTGARGFSSQGVVHHPKMQDAVPGSGIPSQPAV